MFRQIGNWSIIGAGAGLAYALGLSYLNADPDSKLLEFDQNYIIKDHDLFHQLVQLQVYKSVDEETLKVVISLMDQFIFKLLRFRKLMVLSPDTEVEEAKVLFLRIQHGLETFVNSAKLGDPKDSVQIYFIYERIFQIMQRNNLEIYKITT
jgi:hypothetical protein